jgi:hypothetical protein
LDKGSLLEEENGRGVERLMTLSLYTEFDKYFYLDEMLMLEIRMTAGASMALSNCEKRLFSGDARLRAGSVARARRRN